MNSHSKIPMPVLRTWTVEGKADQLFDVEARLVAKIAEALKVEASDVAKAALTDGVRPTLDDFKRYIQASSKLLVKPAAPRELRVASIAVGPFTDGQTGKEDEPTRAGVENALAMGALLVVCAICARIHLREEIAELDRLGVLAIDRV